MTFIVYLCGAIGQSAWLPPRWSCVRDLPQDIIYVVHCWLINPNNWNPRSWLLTYLSDNKVHSTKHLKKCIRRKTHLDTYVTIFN